MHKPHFLKSFNPGLSLCKNDRDDHHLKIYLVILVARTNDCHRFQPEKKLLWYSEEEIACEFLGAVTWFLSYLKIVSLK